MSFVDIVDVYRFWLKLDDLYQDMSQIQETLNENTALGNLPAEPAEPAEVVSASAAQTLPPTRAGGQDGGSYTNSLK